MDKYAKVEKLLSNYKMLKISIENIEEDIKLIEEETGLKGISFDGISTSPTNKTSDIVADTVLAKSEKIGYLKRTIENNQRKIDSVDRALEGLEKLERSVVIEKYVNAKQWWQVASVVCYSESWCKQLRKRAIDKLVIGIYGVK
ncbi:MAG TPA: hypothetical protein VFC79_02200 [Tissierellaceae bacterium]|nr:hypothetical protein [Tissierellaceae bacterium]